MWGWGKNKKQPAETPQPTNEQRLAAARAELADVEAGIGRAHLALHSHGSPRFLFSPQCAGCLNQPMSCPQCLYANHTGHGYSPRQTVLHHIHKAKQEMPKLHLRRCRLENLIARLENREP